MKGGKNMKVTYRERQKIGPFKCIDHEKTFYAKSYFIPEHTSLYYFRLNEFEIKTVGKDELISIEQ